MMMLRKMTSRTPKIVEIHIDPIIPRLSCMTQPNIPDERTHEPANHLTSLTSIDVSESTDECLHIQEVSCGCSPT
jgi:hypothetical protein